MNAFIITGVQRSGTTLLSVMLSKHPDILMERRALLFRLLTCFNESYDLRAFNLERSTKDYYKWLVENDKDERLSEFVTSDIINNSKTTREAISTAIGEKLKKEEKKIWGDKVPNAQFYMKDIALHMPGLKVLHIVRDGRANASSMSNRSSKNLQYSAQHWVDGNAHGLVNQEILGKEVYSIVKYEDLLMFPERTMKEVCAFLNIQFDRKILSPEKNENHSESYVNPQLELSKMDQWRSKLSEKQLANVEKIQAPLLSALGYQINDKKIDIQFVSAFGMIYYQLFDSFKAIFRSEREGMKDQKKVIIKSNFRSRIVHFGRTFVQSVFSQKIYRSLHFRGKGRERRMSDNNV